MLNLLTIKNTVISSDKATYLKNDEIVFTEGKTNDYTVRILS